jgi:oligopeptidase B
MKTTFVLIIALAVSVLSNHCVNAQDDTPVPPVARREVKTTEMHGHKLLDPYFWLREKESKEVIRYLNEENRYCEAMMKDTVDLQKTLFEEMKSRIRETDLSVPEKIGQYYYYSRTEEGKQYRIHCRKLAEENALEEIIFDENKYAEGKPYFAVGALKISPDQYTGLFRRLFRRRKIRTALSQSQYRHGIYRNHRLDHLRSYLGRR